MNKKHILIIEDEEDIQELLAYNLGRESFRVTCVPSGEAALNAIRSDRPSLIILDLMLPGMSGLDFCKRIKSNADTRGIAVVMLTAKGEESDIVLGLELGADDYIPKPFSPRVLIARVRSVLRRVEEGQRPASERTDKVIQIHDLVIHPGRREVLVNGKPAELTATEFDLLRYLAGRPGWVFTRQQILDAVRGHDAIVTDRAVDVQVVGLRKKLGPAGAYIQTVRGVGYRFEE